MGGTRTSAVAIVLAAVGCVRAQVPTTDAGPETARILSRRAAEADAYLRLNRCILGLQLNPSVYVRDVAAASHAAQTALERVLLGVRTGEPAWTATGLCRVPAEIPLDRVLEVLNGLRSTPAGELYRESDLEALARSLDPRVIHVVGIGGPWTDLPPNLPATAAARLTAAPPGAVAQEPAIWKTIPPQERQFAILSAERDAQRRLLKRIHGLRLGPDLLFRDLVTEPDIIEQAASNVLRSYVRQGVFLHGIQPIVQVTGRVPAASVIEMVREVKERSLQGRSLRDAEWETMTRGNRGDSFFQATGFAVPRLPVLQKAASVSAQQTGGPPVPAWALRPIRMEGRGRPPEGTAGTVQGKLWAARVAEREAQRKLIEQLMDLPTDPQGRLRDLVARHPGLRLEIDALAIECTVESTEYEGDTATVTVTLPGMLVWNVITGRILGDMPTR